MDSIFAAVRDIPAEEAAVRAGLVLRPHGRRAWTCCPLHGEDTPSMLFYGDGRGWYCFGCHRGGDALKLYEELYHLEPLDAARKLADDFGIAVDASAPPPKPRPSVHNLARALERRRSADYSRLCLAWRMADGVLRAAAPGSAWDDPVFVAALRARGAADDLLDWLHTAAIDELAAYYAGDEVMHDGRTEPGGPRGAGGAA